MLPDFVWSFRSFGNICQFQFGWRWITSGAIRAETLIGHGVVCAPQRVAVLSRSTFGAMHE